MIKLEHIIRIFLLMIIGTLFISCSGSENKNIEKTDLAYNKAMSDYMKGDLNSAETEFGQIVKDYPGQTTAKIMLGKVYYYKSNFEKAEKQFAETAAQKNADSFLWLAKIYRLKGDLKKTFQYLDKALETDYSSPEIHLEIGRTYNLLGQYDRAIYHLNYALTLLNVKGEVELELSQVYRALGANDKSEKIEKSIMQDPDITIEIKKQITNMSNNNKKKK